MLRCNLKVLLAEMGKTATKVSADTRISRVTLGSLINNQAKGVQFDTINTLCTYLGVSPGKLFSFVPFDIEVERVYISEAGSEITFRIRDNGRDVCCVIPADISISTRKLDVFSVPDSIYIDLCTEENQNTEVFRRYFGSLSQDLKTHVLDMVETAVLTDIEEDLSADIPEHEFSDIQIESQVIGDI